LKNDFAADAGTARSAEVALSGQTYENQQFSGQTLDRLECSETVFSGCRLSECNFRDCDFSRVSFIRCDFSNSDFSESYFRDCVFEECKAVGTQWLQTGWIQVTARKSVFSLANFSESAWKKAELEDCDFCEAVLARCRWEKVRLTQIRLQRACLFRTPLAGMDLTSCETEELVVSGEELRGAVVDRLQASEFAKLLGIVIKE